MAPRAKAGAAATKGGAAVSKSAMVAELSTAAELTGSEAKKVLESLAAVATKEVKKAGKFTIPGLVMIKTRMKPTTKAGKKEIFGKVVMVKAKPATKIVKAF